MMSSRVHPTQVFMHSPMALRVEYCLNDGLLDVSWSPLAGISYRAEDRNFNNRDNPFRVFERIALADCSLEDFIRCDYDPYHCVLHFKHRMLHLSVRPDTPVLLLWSDHPLNISLKSARYDEALVQTRDRIHLRHSEGCRDFEFVLGLGSGEGFLRHSCIHAPGNSHYTQACLSPGQILVLGVGLADSGIAAEVTNYTAVGIDGNLSELEALLLPDLQGGAATSSSHPELGRFRQNLVRCLHSMVDVSGAMRASLKSIYYLIWIRDAAFAINYASGGGWSQRLRALCRLFLGNPTQAAGEGIPSGRMFAQLVHPVYGKYEEDGVFYVIWTVFTHWTQTDCQEFLDEDSLALLCEALDWVERHAFDRGRGLFQSRFADETPALHSRDYGWDYAIGQPAGHEHIRFQGKPVVQSFDIYLNTLMHSAYTMLAAMVGEDRARQYTQKAESLWLKLKPYYDDRKEGLPAYGDLVHEDGSESRAYAWGPVSSVYVWALSLPNFLPLDGRDCLQDILLDRLMAEPDMHWINGLASAVTSVDTWVEGESLPLETLLRIKQQADKPGRYLPMAGAMPEKFSAPEGSLYHDIRPQAFAIGSWLGALASLGLRRLPYGLALRPTAAYDRIENYAWRGRILDFHFGIQGHRVGLELNGELIAHTLQIPESVLVDGKNQVNLVEVASPGTLWLRSTVRLSRVHADSSGMIEWHMRSYGLSSITLLDAPSGLSLIQADGTTLHVEITVERGMTSIHFTHRGEVILKAAPDNSC